jgi:dephospho-CoA kinase
MLETNTDLVLLAGSTEAGKSTAGITLQQMGATRIKIRSVLLGLTTGTETTILGAKTRIGFSNAEFLDALERMRAQLADTAVIESFIDPSLAEWLTANWKHGRCRTAFIDAPLEIRVGRLLRAGVTDQCEAMRIIAEKDRAKGLPDNYVKWRELSDVLIYNDGTLDEFLAQIHRLFKPSRH